MIGPPLGASRGPRGPRCELLRIHIRQSKSAVQFDVDEVRLWTAGINASNNRLAGSVCGIKRECCLRIELLICAQIEYIGKSLLAAGRTPGEAKSLFLKSSAADVPKIPGAREIE